ncbi:hypothetical protein BU23DRAFT_575090 [Bimuria novae-zelandiae CBS 107.79]|uniref:RING-type domain-containing protein n=1 Tax=Bimuria novae-zelandiae CBS 107.79 TaxID=1447943 RepID=A0A6A5UQJ2_9PLEO|nr:hypothetical protein BU23DRAFT_575090 [Bimuria novae-zelandiae CBS 107.79]
MSSLPTRTEFMANDLLTLTDPRTEARPDDNMSCPICMVEISDLSTGVVIVLCGHIYHRECLLRWFEAANARQPSCPLCRRELYANPSLALDEFAETFWRLRTMGQLEVDFHHGIQLAQSQRQTHALEQQPYVGLSRAQQQRQALMTRQQIYERIEQRIESLQAVRFSHAAVAGSSHEVDRGIEGRMWEDDDQENDEERRHHRQSPGGRGRARSTEHCRQNYRQLRQNMQQSRRGHSGRR